MTTIFKKGDRTEHKNYRGICILNTRYKIWRCMHRALSCNMYMNQQDAQNSCD